ncbi:hypothetical protein [Hydrogenophaga sp.]|uniref:hypothetical protein n=1 Tax=Hydrogenophaga sp. TaxID=1904254 RepID=UPI002FC88932
MSSQTQLTDAAWFTSSIVPLKSTRTSPPELAARRGAPFIVSSDVRPSQWHQIDRILHVYSRYGGVMNADQYASVLGEHQPQPASQLARAILNRDLVCIQGGSGHACLDCGRVDATS